MDQFLDLLTPSIKQSFHNLEMKIKFVLNTFYPQKTLEDLESDENLQKEVSFLIQLLFENIENNKPFLEKQLQKVLSNQYDLDKLPFLHTLPLYHFHQKTNLPMASRSIVYTLETDVFPQLNDQTKANNSELVVGLLNTLKLQGGLLIVQDENAWQNFIDTFKQTIQNLNEQSITLKFEQLNQYDFENTTLDYFILNTGYQIPIGKISFENLFIQSLFEFQKTLPENFHYYAPTFADWSKPNVIHLIHLEKLKKTDESDLKALINDQFDTLKNTKTIDLNTINNYKNNDKAHKKIYYKNNSKSTNDQKVKHSDTLDPNNFGVFDEKRLINRLKNVITLTTKLNQTKNTHKKKASSYMKPSRRNPNDPNLKGSFKKEEKAPDIHIYLDTSGSIRPSQYSDALNIIAKIATGMKTNIYFSSFADTLSEEVFLETKKMSHKKILQTIERLPKVTGGTDFELIWNNINKTFEKRERINIIVSDMEFYPNYSNQHSVYDKVFYLPIKLEKSDSVKKASEDLVKNLSNLTHKSELYYKQFFLS